MSAEEDDQLFSRIQTMLSQTREEQASNIVAARGIATSIERLITFLTTHPIESSENRYVLYTTPLSTDTIKTSLVVSGTHQVSLHFFDQQPYPEAYSLLDLPRRLEIDTKQILVVGKHMDTETQTQVDALLKQGVILPNLFDTMYLFSTDGSYAKVAAFPRVVIDHRTDLSDPTSRQRMVRSDMTSSDFQLAQRAVAILTGSVTPAK